MAEEEIAVADVLSRLEAEPLSGPAGEGVVAALTAPGPHIPPLHNSWLCWCQQAKPNKQSGCS